MYRLFKTDIDSMNVLSRLLFNAIFPLRFPNIARNYRKRGADIVGSLTGDMDLKKDIKGRRHISKYVNDDALMVLEYYL